MSDRPFSTETSAAVRRYLDAFLRADEIRDAQHDVIEDARYWGDTELLDVLRITRGVVDVRVRVSDEAAFRALVEDVGLGPSDAATVLDLDAPLATDDIGELDDPADAERRTQREPTGSTQAVGTATPQDTDEAARSADDDASVPAVDDVVEAALVDPTDAHVPTPGAGEVPDDLDVSPDAPATEPPLPDATADVASDATDEPGDATRATHGTRTGEPDPAPVDAVESAPAVDDVVEAALVDPTDAHVPVPGAEYVPDDLDVSPDAHATRPPLPDVPDEDRVVDSVPEVAADDEIGPRIVTIGADPSSAGTSPTRTADRTSDDVVVDADRDVEEPEVMRFGFEDPDGPHRRDAVDVDDSPELAEAIARTPTPPMAARLAVVALVAAFVAALLLLLG